MYYRRIHFLSFFFFSLVAYSSLYGLTSSQKALLDDLAQEKQTNEAIFGLTITEKDRAEGSYASFIEAFDEAHGIAWRVAAALRRHVLRVSSLSIVYAQSTNSYLAGYFVAEGASLTYLNSSGKKLDSFRKKMTFVDDEDGNQTYKRMGYEDQVRYLSRLEYFEVDMVILDADFISEFSKASFCKFLSDLSAKVPFILLNLPKGMKSSCVESDFASVETFGKKSLAVLMTLKGFQFKKDIYLGSLKTYRPFRDRACWVGDEVVIKQYLFTRLNPSSAFHQYKQTLSFYEKASSLGAFLPKLLVSHQNKERAMIIMKREGQDLNQCSDFLSSTQMRDAAFQVLDILSILEKNRMTCGDIRGSNFLINEKGKVFLIDYDLAEFDIGPSLRDFLMVCWNMVNGFTPRHNSEMFLDRLIKLGLASYGPLQKLVKPVFDDKVSSLNELKKYLKDKL